MDGGERRAPQYSTPYQTPSHGRPAPGQPMGPPPQDRFSQTLHTSPRTEMGRQSMTRPYGPSYGAYAYPDQSFNASHMQTNSPMQGVEMHYSNYMPETSRSHQMAHGQAQQSYHGYGQGSMLPPMQQQPMYDTMLQQRQASSLDLMSSQFPMPPYMQHSEHGHAGVGSGQSQYISSPGAYAQQAMTRPQLQAPFTASSSEYSMLDHGDDPESHDPHDPDHDQESLGEGTRHFQDELKASFDTITRGRLTEASEKLLGLSRWLVSSIVSLGLHNDDESRYATRLAMWRELNHCWEALGQKQKSTTEQALRTGRQPADLLTPEALLKLGDELVSMCDQIEQYGLVDYEMGIWEDQILDVFISCYKLLRPEEAAT